MSTFSARLKQVRKKLGYTQSDVSSLVGVSQQSWTRYEGGTRNPTIDVVERIGAVLRVDLNWLLLGKGSFELEKVIDPTSHPDSRSSLPIDDLSIPILGTPLMGNRSSPIVLDSISSYSFALRDWIENKTLATSAENCFMAKVGDSQLAGILDIGDMVLVERCDEVQRHGIYCFFRDGQFVVRFIVRKDGDLLMVPSYVNYPIQKLETGSDFRLFGKVHAALTKVYYEDARWNAVEMRER